MNYCNKHVTEDFITILYSKIAVSGWSREITQLKSMPFSSNTKVGYWRQQIIMGEFVV